jgi:hypothetical protein
LAVVGNKKKISKSLKSMLPEQSSESKRFLGDRTVFMEEVMFSRERRLQVFQQRRKTGLAFSQSIQKAHGMLK